MIISDEIWEIKYKMELILTRIIMKEIKNDETLPGKGTGNNVIIISLIGFVIPLNLYTSYTKYKTRL